MMKSTTIGLAIFLFSMINPVEAQYKQIEIFSQDSSFQLINKLVHAYKPITVLDYGQARVKMYTEIFNQNDSVSCIYTKHILYLNPATSDPIGYLIANGNPNGINCEHTYPQSKGANDGNAKSDMHHLFPSRAAVNEARSNFPFGDVNDAQTMEWFYKSQSQFTIPNKNIEEYSESMDGLFEPREDVKGNIARAVFYFFTMYELQADRNFFERMKLTLCDWHLTDPVDSIEWERTFQIANYQDQKPNPFVLDCSLTKRSYCMSHTLCQKIVTNYDLRFEEILIYPNPFHEEILLTLKELTDDLEIEFIDMIGNPVPSTKIHTTLNAILINTEQLLPGYYLLILKNRHKIFRSKILLKV